MPINTSCLCVQQSIFTWSPFFSRCSQGHGRRRQSDLSRTDQLLDFFHFIVTHCPVLMEKLLVSSARERGDHFISLDRDNSHCLLGLLYRLSCHCLIATPRLEMDWKWTGVPSSALSLIMSVLSPHKVTRTA